MMTTTFAAHTAREAEEHARREAAAIAERAALTAQAEAVTATPTADAILAAHRCGDTQAALFYPKVEAELVAAVRDLETCETAQREAVARGPLTLLQRLNFERQAEPLRVRVPELRALRDACRQVAIRRTRDALAPAIAKAARERNDVLKVAAQHDEEVARLEVIARHFSVRTAMSSRVVGVSRLIR